MRGRNFQLVCKRAGVWGGKRSKKGAEGKKSQPTVHPGGVAAAGNGIAPAPRKESLRRENDWTLRDQIHELATKRKKSMPRLDRVLRLARRWFRGLGRPSQGNPRRKSQGGEERELYASSPIREG